MCVRGWVVAFEGFRRGSVLNRWQLLGGLLHVVNSVLLEHKVIYFSMETEANHDQPIWFASWKRSYFGVALFSVFYTKFRVSKVWSGGDYVGDAGGYIFTGDTPSPLLHSISCQTVFQTWLIGNVMPIVQAQPASLQCPPQTYPCFFPSFCFIRSWALSEPSKSIWLPCGTEMGERPFIFKVAERGYPPLPIKLNIVKKKVGKRR